MPGVSGAPAPRARRAVALAPAKVNLRLCVLAREASGYHGLETLFCALGLADQVVLEPAGRGVELLVEGGVDTGPPERNLARRAAERWYRAAGLEPAVRVRLSKHVPAQAGLGGGSSDAAATLRALDALHGRPLGPARLLQLGIELGSDVPFFLAPSPYALAWSRGERLLALPPLPPRPVLVAHPGEPISTADAFARIAERRGADAPPAAHAMELDALGSWRGLEPLAENQFEPVADEQLPRLREGRAMMRECGARIARLAGSGSALFGVWESEQGMDAAQAELERAGYRCWQTRTLDEWSAVALEDADAAG